MLNRLVRLPLIAALGFGLVTLPALAQDDPSADTVVAVVDGTEITLGHMLVLRAGLPAQFSQLPNDVLFPGILDQLIQQAVLENSFEGEMSKSGRYSMENERRAIISSEILARVSNNAVSDEAIEAAYQENYVNAAQITEYKAAHILVETEDEAKSLVEQLNDGADFAQLAKDNSTGPSGPGGGELGWFAADMMVEPFADAVRSMEPGSISAPVQTQFGWHVIKLDETRNQDRPELETVRAELEEGVRQAAVEAYIADLSSQASIERASGDALDPALLDRIDLLEN